MTFPFSHISFRTEDEKSLVQEFLQMYKTKKTRFETAELDANNMLLNPEILAIHFAEGGAQGDAGAVEFLYFFDDRIQILYGNYVFGNLDLKLLKQKISVLEPLAINNEEWHYPHERRYHFPEEWKYIYMGAGNHCLLKTEICEKALPFLEALVANGGSRSQLFYAIAWFCRAKETSSIEKDAL